MTDQPRTLSPADALKLIRRLASNSANIVPVGHAKKRMVQRCISLRMIQQCCLLGVVDEGPALNIKGNWQLNIRRIVAGESVNCGVAIEWDTKILIVTVI